MQPRNARFQLILLVVFITGCKNQDPDKANYKYYVSSWQGTHVYSPRYDGAILKSRRLISEANRLNGLPGAQIAVSVDGVTHWSENFGFSDLEHGTPVKTNTLFRLASVSKILTTLAVGKLVEEGKLNLDTPIVNYLPELPKHYSQITTRHLVSHQSGIRHYYGADRSEKTKHYDNVTDALDLFTGAPLLFQPGQKCEYSSYGWVVVSAIIQKISGKPFIKYMEEEIWKPIGLENTFGAIPQGRIKDVTHFYLKNSPRESWHEAPYQDFSFNWAGAGFSSNANDLVLIGSELLNGDFLRKETVDLMFTPQVTQMNDTTGFGIGFILYVTHNNEKIIGHSGFMPTAKSHLLLFPESNVVIAFTSNTAMTNFADETLVAIAHNFIEEKNKEDHFIFERRHNSSWTGLWQVEIEKDHEHYSNAYLHFYENNNELMGTLLLEDSEPTALEIVTLKEDSIKCLAPLRSHTATFDLILKEGKISGKSYYNKPLTYLFRKQLPHELEISRMLAPKSIKNGRRLNGAGRLQN